MIYATYFQMILEKNVYVLREQLEQNVDNR